MDDRNDGQPDDAQIAQLARELASAINLADPAGRTGMRDLAIDLLKDEVEGGPFRSDAAVDPDAVTSALNPFALGIPVLLVGGFLSFLFPPVGLVLVAAGIVTCLVGVVLAIGRSLSRRWRARGTVAADGPLDRGR